MRQCTIGWGSVVLLLIAVVGISVFSALSVKAQDDLELPRVPFHMDVTLFRVRDANPNSDYYYLKTSIINSGSRGSFLLSPARSQVRVALPLSAHWMSLYPDAGWQLTEPTPIRIIDGGIRYGVIGARIPAGLVQWYESSDSEYRYLDWVVDGSLGPIGLMYIFRSHCDFLIEVVVPDGYNGNFSIFASVVWYQCLGLIFLYHSQDSLWVDVNVTTAIQPDICCTQTAFNKSHQTFSHTKQGSEPEDPPLRLVFPVLLTPVLPALLIALASLVLAIRKVDFRKRIGQDLAIAAMAVYIVTVLWFPAGIMFGAVYLLLFTGIGILLFTEYRRNKEKTV